MVLSRHPTEKWIERKGKVTDEIVYLTADEEDKYIIAQANAPLDENGYFTTKSECEIRMAKIL